jgi:hypothetical protein
MVANLPVNKFNKNPVKMHLALSIQVILWVLLAQSKSFPDWFYLVCLTAITGLLVIMHLLCRSSAQSTETRKT